MQQPSKLQAASNTFYWNVQCPFFIILRYTNVAIVCTCSLIAPCKIWQHYVHTSWYTWVRLAVLPSLDGVAQPLPGSSLAVAPHGSCSLRTTSTRRLHKINKILVWISNGIVQSTQLFHWPRAPYSSRALLAETANRRLVWQPGLYMECQIPQIDSQPVSTGVTLYSWQARLHRALQRK